jgi:hypothetical protein
VVLPLAPHFREPFHVDGGAIPVGLRHPLEDLDRVREVAGDRARGRAVVERFDTGEAVGHGELLT